MSAHDETNIEHLAECAECSESAATEQAEEAEALASEIEDLLGDDPPDEDDQTEKKLRKAYATIKGLVETARRLVEGAESQRDAFAEEFAPLADPELTRAVLPIGSRGEQAKIEHVVRALLETADALDGMRGDPGRSVDLPARAREIRRELGCA
jgi:hypothetical protein